MTIAAAGVLAVSLAIVLHVGAQAGLGSLMGGDPRLLTSTGLQGDWSWMRNAGYVLVGVGGSAANALLALVGWLVARRGAGRPSTAAVVGWIVFAFNAWMPTALLIASPLLDVGDWMLVIDRFPNRGPLRASAAATGFFIAGLVWKETVASLARLVGNGPPAVRERRATALCSIAWLSGGLVSSFAALFNPVGIAASAPLAVGATFGSTWPIVVAARRVGSQPVPGSPLQVPRSRVLIAVGVAAGFLLISVLGPGVQLGG